MCFGQYVTEETERVIDYENYFLFRISPAKMRFQERYREQSILLTAACIFHVPFSDSSASNFFKYHANKILH